MNTKKWIILGGLFTSLTVGFTSCLEDNDDNNLVYVYTEPVIVKSPKDSTVMLHSQHGPIKAPSLNSKVKYGDYLLSWFYMDVETKPYTAANVEYLKMGADTVTIVEGNGLTDNFTDSISDVKLYINQNQDGFIFVDSTFFASIKGKEQQKYTFELLAHKDSVNSEGIPTLFLRGKKMEAEPLSSSISDGYNPFALNLTTLKVPRSEPGTITFNLKYKSGTNGAGKDVYTNYRNNPVTLKYTN